MRVSPYDLDPSFITHFEPKKLEKYKLAVKLYEQEFDDSNVIISEKSPYDNWYGAMFVKNSVGCDLSDFWEIFDSIC